jgi:hypothetical protein
MVEWTNTPPADQNGFAYRLIRVPAARPIRLIILSPQPIGTNTHYHKGRTKPCDGQLCEACQLGLPYRWHSYIAVHNADTGENALLELTAQATEQLQPARDEFHTLRAVKLVLERPSHRPNGRIHINIHPGRAAELGLPDPPEVQRILLHIWGLDDRPLAQTTNRLQSIGVTPTPKSNGDRYAHESATV